MWAIAEVVEAIERAREPFDAAAAPAEQPPVSPARPAAEPAATPAKRTLSDRLTPTVRRAIQATVGCGLAILSGELLSEQRWYWAVITAFMVFVGTGSAGQTLVKGFRRVAGTLIGVVAGTVVASLLGGHLELAVVLAFVCIFAGFYALTLSYGLMVFFITVMLGMLYSLLGTFHAGVVAAAPRRDGDRGCVGDGRGRPSSCCLRRPPRPPGRPPRSSWRASVTSFPTSPGCSLTQRP
ncbi:FUSC family protein [Fodinicola feengrottensis]|uniref:FUSC family protein n=1 Tax=Fodinicola feengrottensis TaxID=435914 RepID=UPI0024419CCB|nr:FUSC family protein [Fodinicola feengrottensis]